MIPATGLNAEVTGPTAQSRDFNDLMKSRAPLVFLFVIAMAFVLLLVTFRSIVIPIKAIALNLLSVGASYGVLVLVFQHGLGESLLGFKSTGAITPWLPLFLFVILFGLSMDYHVFILSRVREAYDKGLSTEDAVRERDQEHGRRGHERGGRDGRGVRDLRLAGRPRVQADGRGPGDRDPDRRDHRPGRTAARDDEAPGRLELVPAEVARLAATSRPRAGPRVARATHPKHRRPRLPRAPVAFWEAANFSVDPAVAEL